MKRALYSIPLLGFGVTMVGCQDPVVGDFDVKFFDGTGVPLAYSVLNAGVTCSLDADATMSVDKELLATITVNYNYACDDGSQNEQLTYTYTGTFEVIEKGFTYKITLADAASSFVLDCSMNAAGVLFCGDESDSAFVFEPL